MNLKGSENWVKFLFSHKNRKTGLSCWFFFLKTKFKVQKTELWRVLFLEMFRLEFYNHIVSFCNWSKKLVKTPGEQLAFAETILNFHDFFCTQNKQYFGTSDWNTRNNSISCHQFQLIFDMLEDITCVVTNIFPLFFLLQFHRKIFWKKHTPQMKYAVFHPYNKSCTAMQFLKPVVEVVRYTLKYHLDQEGFEL